MSFPSSTHLLVLVLCAMPVAGCGDEQGVPDRPASEVLETYDEGDDADQMVLDQLVEAGSDLTQATDVRWYVYFASDRAAEAFAGLAREGGWKVDRRAAAQGTSALCLCSREAVPRLETIRAMEAELKKLGEGLNPDIDGWEAAVQR